MRRLWIATAIAMGVCGTTSADEVARHYSADVSTTVDRHLMTMKLYVDGGKARIEMRLPQEAQQAGFSQIVTIVRPDLQRTYTLYPDQRAYQEAPLNIQDAQWSAVSNPDAAGEAVGTDTVNGQLCTKYRVTTVHQTAFIWAKQGTGIPVRMMSADGGAVMEFTNVRIEPQPTSLFAVPAGYQQGAGLAGMMPSVPNAAGSLPSSDELPPEVTQQMRELLGGDAPQRR